MVLKECQLSFEHVKYSDKYKFKIEVTLMLLLVLKEITLNI